LGILFRLFLLQHQVLLKNMTCVWKNNANNTYNTVTVINHSCVVVLAAVFIRDNLWFLFSDPLNQDIDCNLMSTQ